MVTKQSEDIPTFHYLPARVLDLVSSLIVYFIYALRRVRKSSLTELQCQIKKQHHHAN